MFPDQDEWNKENPIWQLGYKVFPPKDLLLREALANSYSGDLSEFI